jgi:hypothetical protein
LSEERGAYLTEEEQAIIGRLLAVFTPVQLLKIAERAGEMAQRRFGRIEIRIRGERIFIDTTTSDDCGKIRKT